MEIRRLTWRDVLFPGDIRLTHEPKGSAALVIIDPKNDKVQTQLRVFTDAYVITALRIVKEEQVSCLGTDMETTNREILDQHICPNLEYRDYNNAINQAAEHYGLGKKQKFTTHGALIGAATAAFTQTKDLGAIKLAGGWKSQQSAEYYIRNGRTAIATLGIAPEVQNNIMAASKRFARRMTRYAENAS